MKTDCFANSNILLLMNFKKAIFIKISFKTAVIPVSTKKKVIPINDDINFLVDVSTVEYVTYPALLYSSGASFKYLN